MDKKSWYKSKTIWAGIVGVIIAVYNSVLTSLASGCGVEGGLCVNLPIIPDWAFAILGAFGIYSRAVTNTVIK